MKSKYTKPPSKLFVGIIFLIIIFTSPWFLILVRNAKLISFNIKPLNFGNPVITYEINTERSLLPARMFVNKVSYYSLEVLKRYFETFDPQYLFFTGDLDITKSTRTSGPIYLAMLPLILAGVYSFLSAGKIRPLVLLAILSIPPSLIEVHYETISRIPVFLVLSYFAACGLTKLVKTKRTWAVLLLILFLFEFSRFVHNLLIHYHP